MKAAQVNVGSRLVDSVALVQTPAMAQKLKASGVDGVIQYLGTVTPKVIENIIGAGMGFMPVTYADTWDPSVTIVHLNTLGLPQGCDVWFDIESVTTKSSSQLITAINAWAHAIAAEGFAPCMYVGAGVLLTSQELYSLGVVRYWKGLSRIVDRAGQLAEPECGWCMTQLYPSVTWGGMYVDVNFVQQDYHGRLPTWAIASITPP